MCVRSPSVRTYWTLGTFSLVCWGLEVCAAQPFRPRRANPSFEGRVSIKNLTITEIWTVLEHISPLVLWASQSLTTTKCIRFNTLHLYISTYLFTFTNCLLYFTRCYVLLIYIISSRETLQYLLNSINQH